MDPRTRLRQAVKARGLRETSQREAVLAYLVKTAGHLSQEEIHQGLRTDHRGVGRATVFRTLKLLEEAGLVSRVTFADGLPRYEYSRGGPPHDHLICVHCGTVQEFSSPAIERLQARAAASRRFDVLWHRLDLFGRCARCR